MENTNEEFRNGANIDPRPLEQKIRDFAHAEISASAPIVEWKEKDKDERRFFSKRNQAYSSSCMAQSGVKTLGVENFVEEGVYVEPSAMEVYRSRSNFPYGGMFLQDCLSLLAKPKACLESSLPSQGMSEEEMNQKTYTFNDLMKQEAEKYRANGYVTWPIGMDANGKVVSPVSIDEIASVIAQGKAVQLMFYFMGNEYWKTNPRVTDHSLGCYEARTSRHGVSAVDFFLDDDGDKCLLIEDSAGNSSSIDKKGQRIITEDFLKERCFGAGYLIYRKNESGVTPKPQHTFTTTMRYGTVSDEVRELQKVLVYEGFMPAVVNGVPFVPTRNFLGMTHSGTLKFQVKYGLSADGIVGPKTRAKLNELYA